MLSFLHYLSSILLPKRCVLCQIIIQTHDGFCQSCLKDLPYLQHACQQCASPLFDSGKICGFCLKRKLPFTHSLALFSYEPPISNLIVALKFGAQLQHARTFSQLFIKAFQKPTDAMPSLPDIILPVPLHVTRMRERGFNQAIEIARPISKALNIPLDLTGVIRQKITAPQTNLSAKERIRNMRGAFSAQRDYQNLTVAILDDVITTTTTIHALSKVLQKQGARAIYVWACARRTLR